MADGGREDYWAPDSELEPVEPGQFYPRCDGQLVEVMVNDFVDLGDSVPLDPLWGSSFQVARLDKMTLVVKMLDTTSGLYEPTTISPDLITNDYVRATVYETADDLPPGSIYYPPEVSNVEQVQESQPTE